MRFLVLIFALFSWPVLAMETALYVEVKEFANYPEITEKSYSELLERKWNQEEGMAHSLATFSVEQDGSSYYPLSKNILKVLEDNKPLSFVYWQGHLDNRGGKLRLITAEASRSKGGILLQSLDALLKARGIVFIHSKLSANLRQALKKEGRKFRGSIIVLESKAMEEFLKHELFAKTRDEFKVLIHDLKKKAKFLSAGQALELTQADVAKLRSRSESMDVELRAFKDLSKVRQLYGQMALYKQKALKEKDLSAQFDAWRKVVSLGEKSLCYLEKSAYEDLYLSLKAPVLKDLGHPDWPEFEALVRQAKTYFSRGQFSESLSSYRNAQKSLSEISVILQKHLESLLESSYKSNDKEGAKVYLKSLLILNPDLALSRGFLGHVHRNRFQMNFSYIPAGEFYMGSANNDSLREYDEGSHLVRFSKGFYMGQTEVSVEQWRAVMGDDQRMKSLLAQQAAVNISWEDAQKFLKKLSELEGLKYRLPTEAEWEYACRAGSRSRYSSGDTLDKQAFNVKESNRSGAWMVGESGRANSWGLFDMHGNVWEWCSDWSGPYDLKTQVNPRGISDEQAREDEYESRVVRGGSWADVAQKSRSANRWEYSPYVQSKLIGFRVVLELNK